MNKFEPLNLETESVPTEELLPISFITKLKDSLRERLDPSEGQQEDADQMRALIELKLQGLRNNYPDWQVYQTYYVLSGQPVPKNISKVDFPDDDSIIAFIESL